MADNFFPERVQAADSPRARYNAALKVARAKLVAKGYDATSAVFLASTDVDADEDGKPTKPAAICEATGDVASHRMAQKSHRLATDEEIARFHAEQKERERECARTEQIARERDGRAGSASDIAAAILEAHRVAQQTYTEPAAASARPGNRKTGGTERE